MCFTVFTSFTVESIFGGTWVSLAPISEAREGYGAAIVNDKIYYIGGFNGSFDRATVFIYDIATNTWSTGANLPSPSRAEFGAVTNGTHIFVVGGRAIGLALNIVDVYDPSTDTWTRVSSMPISLATEYCVIYFNGKIYVAGGRTGASPSINPVKTLLIYDIATDTWSYGADLPFNVSDASAIVFDNKIYLFGGFDAYGNVLNTALIYDIATDTWSFGASMPKPRADAAVGRCSSRILVIGGWNGYAMTDTVFVYNPYTNSWDTGPPMPSPKAETQGVTEIHSTNVIHVVSGGMFGSSAGTDHYAFICPTIGGEIDVRNDETTEKVNELRNITIIATLVLVSIMIASIVSKRIR